MRSAAPAPAAIAQNVQLFLSDPLELFGLGGREYCWYDDGWRGSGWYWCGYGYRDGFGWGGGEGFQGWGEHRYERDWRRVEVDRGGGYREDDDEGSNRRYGGPIGGFRHREGGGFRDGGPERGRIEHREGERNRGGGGFREGGHDRGGGFRQGIQDPAGAGFRNGVQIRGGGGEFHGGHPNFGGGGGGGGNNSGGGNQNRGGGGPINGAPVNRGGG